MSSCLIKARVRSYSLSSKFSLTKLLVVVEAVVEAKEEAVEEAVEEALLLLVCLLLAVVTAAEVIGVLVMVVAGESDSNKK